MATMGVYAIKNKVNGKIYIGSSNDLHRRKLVHFRELTNNKHCNRWLQKSFIKHGMDNFEFEIIEEVQDELKLIEREQYWLDFHKSYQSRNGYNICKVAGGTDGITYTEESKQKISESRLGCPGTGKNTKGDPNNFKAKTYCFKDQDGNNIEIKNLEEYCRQHSLDESHMRKVFYGRAKTHAGYSLPDYNPPPVKEYDFKDPQGNIHHVVGNLKKWCRENNLRYSSVQYLVSGKVYQVQGWSRPLTELKSAYYKIQHPDNSISETNNLAEFCRQNNLDGGAMALVVQGKLKQHKGFKVLESYVPPNKSRRKNVN